MRKVLPATKILILSGYNEFDYARAAIQIGNSDYLLKPVTRQSFVEYLTRVQIDKACELLKCTTPRSPTI